VFRIGCNACIPFVCVITALVSIIDEGGCVHSNSHGPPVTAFVSVESSVNAKISLDLPVRRGVISDHA